MLPVSVITYYISLYTLTELVAYWQASE
jgi:hypothetical protein